MSLRKFYLVLSSILLTFLFSAGILILNYLQAYSMADPKGNPGSTISQDNILSPFIKDKKEPYNVIVMVGDESEANTDTMMVVNYNRESNEANIISIPRDTKVDISGDRSVKINSLYANRGGKDILMRQLSNIFGVEIKYYVYFDLKSVRDIINILEGVWIDVPVDLKYDDPLQNLHIDIKKGTYLMDGKMAEEYLRFRHPNNGYTEEMLKYYDGSDLKRINAQQNFIKEVIKQKASIKYLTKVNSIIDSVFENLSTNVSISDVLAMAQSAKDVSLEKIKIHTLPGEAQEGPPYYYLYDRGETEKLVEDYFFK